MVVFDRATLATVATIPAGTNPDGIVFEPATQTVWAFNGRSKDVSVIDAATRKVVATIALPGKPEFPAVDGKGTVFDNIEDKSEIVRLDAHTNTLTATWPLPAATPPPAWPSTSPARASSRSATATRWPWSTPTPASCSPTPAIGDGPDAAGWNAAHKLAFASSR